MMANSKPLFIHRPVETDQKFRDISHDPGLFFNVLPDDWKEGIEPLWPRYEQTSAVFVLEEQGEVACGGIIFSTNPPDTSYVEEAAALFAGGFLYIGFLWVPEKFRGKKLGLEWINRVRRHYPGQSFWLAIDDYGLKNFYEKTGFHLIREVEATHGKEWILIDGPVLHSV